MLSKGRKQIILILQNILFVLKGNSIKEYEYPLMHKSIVKAVEKQCYSFVIYIYYFTFIILINGYIQPGMDIIV